MPTAKAISASSEWLSRPRPTTLVQREEDRGRSHHPANGSDHRERDRSQVPGVTMDELALDLHTDKQDENCHERVVHPRLQRQVIQ